MATADDNPTEPLGDRGAQHTAPLPDPRAQWVLAGPHPPAKRRRVWPWFVIAGALVAALAVGVLVAEPLARAAVTDGIRDRVIAELDLPEDQRIDVVVEGWVLPQLVVGTLTDVTIASEDVTFDAFTGDVTVSAQGIPLRGGAEMDGGHAVIRLDEDQLRALLATVDGFPADSLGLDAPDVTMSTDLNVFGIQIPVGVALTPSAADGDLVLTPSSLQVSGVTLSAQDLRARFGDGVADAVARDWPVCVAQYLPAGLTLTAVAVDGAELVADFDIAGGIVSDPALLENGTCG